MSSNYYIILWFVNCVPKMNIWNRFGNGWSKTDKIDVNHKKNITWLPLNQAKLVSKLGLQPSDDTSGLQLYYRSWQQK